MEMDKHVNSHSYDGMIRSAIRAIALKGVVNKNSGVVRGTAKTTGYVVKIHDDETDELFGTIDVQEYADWATAETEERRYGYHEGVLLTAIQNDWQGYVIIPKMYSEVLLSKDPETGNEYVTMFSHVDLIQLDSHEKISIGVREREPFDPDDENSPDVHELELTGVQTNTTYSNNSIKTEVKTAKDKPKAVVTQILGQSENGLVAKQDVGGQSSSTITPDDIVLEHDKANMTLDGSQATLEMGQSKIKVTNGTTYVGSENSTDDAVLGQQLASILGELVGYLGQMMTPTMMGPQPPANVLASFISLKAKIQSFASSHCGFLTPRVQIQK